MHHTKQPGARFLSDRAGDFVLGGTLPYIIGNTNLQRHRLSPCRVIGWCVNRWLGVETVEVRYGPWR